MVFNIYASANLLCESSIYNLQTNVSALNDVKCANVNNNYKCEEVEIDKDKVRKDMERDLAFAMDPTTKNRIQTDWGKFSTQLPKFKKFFSPKATADKSRPEKPPTFILDWFNDPSFANSSYDQASLKKAFIDKYVNFSEKYGCNATFFDNDAALVKPDPFIKAFNTKGKTQQEIQRSVEQMKKDMADPVHLAKVREFLQKDTADDNASDNRFTVCRMSPESLQAKKDVLSLYPPCVSNMKKFFKDNSYDIKGADLNTLLSGPEASEVIACIKERLDRGAKIKAINIQSSASALNNTGSAADKFCKKGFQALSEARANSAKNMVLPKLFEQAGYPQQDIDSKLTMSTSGSNGDGTSGPCVYTEKNGVETLKPYFNTAEGKKDLEENKYVKIFVSFEESSNEVKDSSVYRPQYRCKKIEFKCL